MKYNHFTYIILALGKNPYNIAIIMPTLSLKIPKLEVTKKYFVHISHSKKSKSQNSDPSWIKNCSFQHTRFSWAYKCELIKS